MEKKKLYSLATVTIVILLAVTAAIAWKLTKPVARDNDDDGVTEQPERVLQDDQPDGAQPNLGQPHSASRDDGDEWAHWHRPVENTVFTTQHGNNHDAILFVEPSLEYPYHLIVSHTKKGGDLWRAKHFSWNSADWELVSGEYKIADHYEYDDGVKVGDTYFIFEDGNVYTFSGSLEVANGKWEKTGSFPKKKCEDIGVYYEDGVFHIFGEYGDFPHGFDGTSLSHMTSSTGLGDWAMVDPKAIDPNPDGGHKYGLGDPTIARIEANYYIFHDRESQGSPYKVVGWRADSIDGPYESLGKVIEPRRDQSENWDNNRIQDADIGFIPDLSRYVMVCNMRDLDGNPGGEFPNMGGNRTRVVGFFYSTMKAADSK